MKFVFCIPYNIFESFLFLFLRQKISPYSYIDKWKCPATKRGRVNDAETKRIRSTYELDSTEKSHTK